MLYQQPGAANGGFQPLIYLEVPASALAPGPAAAASFPLLPYAGVTAADLDPFRDLEIQVISPLRRSTIATHQPRNAALTRASSPSADPVYGTTPQGLLAQFASDFSQWTQLIMAQMTSQQFMLTNIPNSTNLYAALQSNQLFLVISDPAAISAYLQAVNARITIEGWSFDLNPSPAGTSTPWTTVGLPGLQGTILIFKFFDKALTDLSRDPGTWAQANSFNSDPASTSQIMTRIVENGIASAVSDSDFAAFAAIVSDPHWHGILVLNGNAPLTTLPSEFEGVAAGIDPSLFFAHHIGISASAVNQSTTPISINNSSLFGLINYQAPGPLLDNGDSYQFRVKLLKVLFASSGISSYTSQIELKINELFGEPVTLQHAATSNVIELFGVLQQQVLPDGSEHDSYFFETASNSSVVLDMQSAIFNAIQITKAQFITEVDASANVAATLTQTRFVFWGLLDFARLPGFDLFSFGREDGATQPSGLSFANLALSMVFDPGVPDSETFMFDASQISFDLAGSVARAESLFSHFPLTLASFTEAKSGDTPPDLGYMGVQSPLNQSTLVYPWYALNFDLNLGTIGALAGQAGFVVSLTAAWSPSQRGYSVFTGLGLPGSNGGKREISIEGVLKITFKTIALLVDTSASKASYILLLYTVGLKFLSKSFPPTGQINLVLFGDPDSGAENTSLGWYVAYAKPGTATKPRSGQALLTLQAAQAQARQLPEGE